MANKEKNDVGAIIERFAEHIDSLHASLLLSMFVIEAARRSAVKSYHEFVSKNCKEETREGKKVVLVTLQHERRYDILHKRAHQSSIAFSVVPRSFLVSLVSQFDAFVGSLVGALFRLKPELLKSFERTLSLSQLSDFGSMEAAKDYVIEKEIETLLRKSHSEQFDWLEKKFDVKLHVELPIWPSFIEVTERRNLFVHSDGIVSSQYLKVCRENSVTLEAGVEVGKELEVSHTYFTLAHAAIYEIGVKLAQVLWRKVLPSQLKEPDDSLSNMCFELIQEENYELAKTLLNFACSTPMKHADERSRLVFLVNKAQAYKWSGDSKAALEIVKKQDWSATGDAFQLAEAVLTDNFQEAVRFMQKIGSTGYPHKEHYKTWPLFKEFRKSQEFRDAFEKIFGESPSRTEPIDEADVEETRSSDSEPGSSSGDGTIH